MSRARHRSGDGIDSFLSRIARVVADVQRLVGSSGEVSRNDVESCVVRIEYLIRNVERIEDMLQADQYEALATGHRALLLSIEASRVESDMRPTQRLSVRQMTGSPSYDIPQQQLQFLIQYGFTGIDISSLLDV